MFETKIELPELKSLTKDLGLEPMGAAQRHLVSIVARRIVKYIPKRAYGSVEKAIEIGQELNNGRIVIQGPHIKYLYFGKVMVGKKPKEVTKVDLKYTTTFNRLAGPFWDDRLMTDEKNQIIEEEKNFILRGVR